MIRASASHASGICGWEWGRAIPNGDQAPPTNADLVPDGQRSTHSTRLRVLSHLRMFEGSGSPFGHYVTVQACGGTTATTIVEEYLRPIDIGLSDVKPGWHLSRFAGHVGGSTIWTAGRGGFHRTVLDLYWSDHTVGLVMAKGPGRGMAAVRVDGRQVAVVDTYAPVNTNSQLVWSGRLGNGHHELRVVNLATPGHPRIDVDAFVWSHLPGRPPGTSAP